MQDVEQAAAAYAVELGATSDDLMVSDNEVGAVRRFFVVAAVRGSLALSRWAMRRLPEGHAYREFKRRTIAAREGVDRWALGSAWDTTWPMRLALGLIVAAAVALCALACIFVLDGAHHVIAHHRLPWPVHDDYR